MQQSHPISPVYNKDSKILILGSFPSVKSRETGFFYGHPQNRFWRVLAAIFENDTPQTISQKECLLHAHGIALWDVIASCKINGSSDSSITDVLPNDLSMIFGTCNIQHIYVNGKTAEKLYCKYQQPQCGSNAISLPSTSPANAAWSLEHLCEAWSVITL